MPAITEALARLTDATYLDMTPDENRREVWLSLVAAARREYDQLRIELDAAMETLDQAEQDRREYRATITQREVTIANLRASIAGLQDRIESLDDERSMLTVKLHRCRAERDAALGKGGK